MKTTRETREISIGLIDIDHLPLNATGLATTLALKTGIPMPPIKVAKLACGRFLIRDGRHRYLAHKLLGRKTIKARMSVKPFRSANITTPEKGEAK